MKRFCKGALRVAGVVMVMLVAHNDLFSQTTSSSANGLWTSLSNWIGTPPGMTNLASNITINTTFPNYIAAGSYPAIAGDRLTFAGGNNDDKAITINGTLVVYGDMRFGNKAMDLVIPSGGVLIILGDLYMDNKIDLSLGGILVVKGAFDKTGAANQGSFTGTGNVYAGSYTGVASDLIPVGSEKLVNPHLINDPSLQYIENFLNSGSGGQGPLPVELLFFKANQAGEKVDLTWATASERNFDYFSVERSSNGVDFVEIEQVKGNGTTNERKDYNLADNFPMIGRNYYRIKSVDYDGYIEHFNVAVVNFSGEKAFSVAPNPSDGTIITFAMNFVPDNTTTITIFDNFSSTIEVVRPTDQWQSVNFANSLKSGLYFARIVSKDFVRVERFIVR